MAINPATFQSIPALAAPELPAGPTSMERAFSILASGMGGVTKRKGAKKDREAALLNVLLPAFAQQNRLNPVVQGGGGIPTPIGNMEIGPVVPKTRSFADQLNELDFGIRTGARKPDKAFVANQAEKIIAARQRDPLASMQLYKQQQEDPTFDVARYWTEETRATVKRLQDIYSSYEEVKDAIEGTESDVPKGIDPIDWERASAYEKSLMRKASQEGKLPKLKTQLSEPRTK